MKVRTTTQDSKLKSMVGQLWGAPQVQKAPEIYYQTKKEHEIRTIKDGQTITEMQTETTNHPLPLDSSNLQVGLNLQHRKKGLLWYATYRVQFSAHYSFSNPTSESREILVRFQLPSKDAVYDNFRFAFGGKDPSIVEIQSGGVYQSIVINPGQTSTLNVYNGGTVIFCPGLKWEWQCRTN
jgi:hypothetical protein